ncbi:hypothetical protein [Novosphingobium colocasiae]|uniref:hypothetical protein n=1 Tax=Novosphingobium colocasiae TaxID=1256513 RepID=UPI0035B02FB9
MDDIAARVTHHTDAILRAAGSGLRHYTSPHTRRTILSAAMDMYEEAYRAGAAKRAEIIADIKAPPMTDKLIVEQVDREAAAALAQWLINAQKEWGMLLWFSPHFPYSCREGVWDEHEFVQAFARHRIAALATRPTAPDGAPDGARGAVSDEARGGDVEAVGKAIVEEIGWGVFDHFDPNDIRRISRATIAAMKPRADPPAEMSGIIHGSMDKDFTRVAALPRAEGEAKPEWRCFHCGDTFTDEQSARLHFGRDERSEAACVIKAGAEGQLLKALRDAEYQADDAIQRMHDESTDAAKAYHQQRCRHTQALIAAEELGYERGLTDGRAHPPAQPAERALVEEDMRLASVYMLDELEQWIDDGCPEGVSGMPDMVRAIIARARQTGGADEQR